MQERLVNELVTNAFNAAWNQRKPGKGLIIHSDRGIQYAGQQFRQVLSNHACIQSMSATGNCYDNAVTETFFHSLKVELVHRKTFISRNDARKNIFKYIESFYNRQRLHSTLGYASPVEFEELAAAGKV
jgi:transposase InsO family protein